MPFTLAWRPKPFPKTFRTVQNFCCPGCRARPLPGLFFKPAPGFLNGPSLVHFAELAHQAELLGFGTKAEPKFSGRHGSSTARLWPGWGRSPQGQKVCFLIVPALSAPLRPLGRKQGQRIIAPNFICGLQVRSPGSGERRALFTNVNFRRTDFAEQAPATEGLHFAAN